MAGTPQQGQSRRHKRQAVEYTAWIMLEPGQPPYRCILLDVSEGGAKIRIDEQLTPPGEFTLLLSARGKSRRMCRVIWRNGSALGVEFVRPQTQVRKFSRRGS
jgi:hypothetical protein